MSFEVITHNDFFKVMKNMYTLNFMVPKSLVVGFTNSLGAKIYSVDNYIISNLDNIKLLLEYNVPFLLFASDAYYMHDNGVINKHSGNYSIMDLLQDTLNNKKFNNFNCNEVNIMLSI